MRIFSNSRLVSGLFCALVLSCASTRIAHAGQQQWASQTVQWRVEGTVREVTNIEQQLWIPKANASSFWPMYWTFHDLDYGGYIGLQQEASSRDQNVRFSIWNATGVEGKRCRNFDGEGIGKTCTLPVKIDPAHVYTVRVSRLQADDGQWWGGWLIETMPDGANTERFIGKIKAPSNASSINRSSIGNFVEYFGPSKERCASVPLSIAAFAPPAINIDASTGRPQGIGKLATSTRATRNFCSITNERNGAYISTQRTNFGRGVGILMFLGGELSQHRLESPLPVLAPAMQ